MAVTTPSTQSINLRTMRLREAPEAINRISSPEIRELLTIYRENFNTLLRGVQSLIVDLDQQIAILGGGVGPMQPLLANWSLAVVEYYYDEQTLTNMARVDATITNLVSSVSSVRLWAALEVVPSVQPTNIDDYKDTGVMESKAAVGSTVARWRTPQPTDADVAYWIFPTASSNQISVVPTAAHLAIARRIVIAKVGPPAQSTYFAVSILDETRTGIPGGYLQYTIVRPNDPTYFGSEVERRKMTDGTFTTPVGGAEGNWNYVDTFEYSTITPEWWAYPTTAQFWQFRLTAVSRAFDSSGNRIRNTTDQPQVNVTVTASSGIDAKRLTAVSDILSPELQFVLGKIGVKVDGNDIRIDPITHTLYVNGISAARLYAGTTIGAGVIFAGVLAANVVYAGSVNVSQLTAGTATFAGDVLFQRGAGASVGINSTGIVLTNSFQSRVEITATGVTIQNSGLGKIQLDQAGNVLITGNLGTSTTINGNSIGSGSYIGLTYETFSNGSYVLGGTVVLSHNFFLGTRTLQNVIVNGQSFQLQGNIIIETGSFRIRPGMATWIGHDIYSGSWSPTSFSKVWAIKDGNGSHLGFIPIIT